MDMVVLDDGDEVDVVALAYYGIHNQVEVVAMDDDGGVVWIAAGYLLQDTLLRGGV